LISDIRKTEIVAGKTRTEGRFYDDDAMRKFNGQHQKHYVRIAEARGGASQKIKQIWGTSYG
jgi:hypothetical protein